MLPHVGVYTRLGVSEIHGIGVFAILQIEKGTALFEYDNTKMVWIESDILVNIPKEIRDFICQDNSSNCNQRNCQD